MRCRYVIGSALFLASCTAAATPATAGKYDGWELAGDIGEVSLVTLALGKSAVEKDWKGAKQFGIGLGVTAGTTLVLKQSIHELRPDGSDRQSFPSGHTSVSFSAAGYLHQRYGWRWGLPATIAAGFVGLSRVEAKKHYWHDVVAGAALGEATAFLFTSPRDSNVRVLPWAESGGGGFVLRAEF